MELCEYVGGTLYPSAAKVSFRRRVEGPEAPTLILVFGIMRNKGKVKKF